MKKIIIPLLLASNLCLLAQKQIQVGFRTDKESPPYDVGGTIFSSATGDPLPGANIYLLRQAEGTTTDTEGNFSLSLYEGLYQVQISSVGYQSKVISLNVLGSGIINFLMEDNITELNEVMIQAEGVDNNVVSKEIGKNTITVESIKELPPIAGEVDVIKALSLLPGVSTVGETSGGFNVRGGGTDQNLVVVGGATIYNPNHLFGFFSAINPMVVRSVDLYKGAVPSFLGGRGSSILEINYKKGDLQKWNGVASVGMVSTKASIEGPVITNKASLLLAGRYAYPNWLLSLSRDPDYKNGGSVFYDGNAIASVLINNRNELELSYYKSFDAFQFTEEIINEWSNEAQSLLYRVTIGSSIIASIGGVRSTYKSKIIDNSPFESFELENGIEDLSSTAKIEYNQNENHNIQIGYSIRKLEINPGELTPGDDSDFSSRRLDSEQGFESALFFHHDLELSEKLGVFYGIRYSWYSNYGPGSLNQYRPLRSRSIENVVGIQEYLNDQQISKYSGYEPRIAVRYSLTENTSIKGGYTRMYQYIHQITNTTSISPVSIWKLSDPYLQALYTDQFSIGAFKNFQSNRYESSIEAYYKDINNTVDYKDGANLFMNGALETVLLSGLGKSYGLELYIRKTRGRLNGWISYTLSRSLQRIDGAFLEETINNGNWYSSNFDRPHNYSMVTRYRIGPLSLLSMTFSYASGRPFSAPDAKFLYRGDILGYFPDRNSERGPDFHRLDLSLQFSVRRAPKILSGEWNLSVYNLYGRKNAFSVFFRDLPNVPPQPYSLAVVGFPLPAISYEILF